VTQSHKRPAAGEEGALQTRQIMDAVKALRIAKDWSAERLAEEMTKAGVPWNRHIVANLEQGRRKSLRVHELLTLAWVLDAASPVDLLVPDLPREPMYPVTPSTLLFRDAVRAWFRGETGPLREWLKPSEGEQEDLAALLEDVPPGMREQIIQLARSAAGKTRVDVMTPRAGAG
jgi:hypothetical protein